LESLEFITYELVLSFFFYRQQLTLFDHDFAQFGSEKNVGRSESFSTDAVGASRKEVEVKSNVNGRGRARATKPRAAKSKSVVKDREKFLQLLSG
jgi:hypothetical protein